MVRQVSDALRAGEVLSEFRAIWKFELTDDIAGTVLNFKLNREVDAVCRRLAVNLELPIDKVTAAMPHLAVPRSVSIGTPKVD